MNRVTLSPFLFAVPVLSVLLLGCGGWHSSDCKAPTCENGTYVPELQAGTVTWLLNGSPLASATIATGYPGLGIGILSITAGKLDNPANPEHFKTGSALTLTVTHQPVGSGKDASIEDSSDASVDENGDAGREDPGPHWTVRFRILGDPRAWTIGEMALPNATVDENYEFNRATSMIIGNPADMHLLVTEAVGGPADFPAMVTPDFLRVFRLDYAGARDDFFGAHARLSLTFTLTAADFSVRQEICARCA